MPNQVYVGNLSFDTTAETLRTEFSKEGRTVTRVVLVKSPKNGRPRGFGFIEMETAEQVHEVIRDLQGVVIDGRAIHVNVGKEPPEFQVRPSREQINRKGGGRRRGRG